MSILSLDNPKLGNGICAVISCFLSFCVLLTFLSFKKMRSRIFMKVIFHISLCDFIANATIFSDNPEGTLCFLQGILQQIFYFASWVWTVLLAYLLFSLVYYGRIKITLLQMYIIGYSIPIIAGVLPLSTDTYDSNPTDDDWCWINPADGASTTSAIIWQIFIFHVPIFSCVLIMTYWGLLIYWKVYIKKVYVHETVKSALGSLFMYPVLVAICWIPNVIQTITAPHSPASSPYTQTVNCLSILHGGFTAIVFFSKSRESRYNWLLLFTTVLGLDWGKNALMNSQNSTDSKSSASHQNVADFAEDEMYRDGSLCLNDISSIQLSISHLSISDLKSPMGHKSSDRDSV